MMQHDMHSMPQPLNLFSQIGGDRHRTIEDQKAMALKAEQRTRLMVRFDQITQAMTDHELLELLLLRVVPAEMAGPLSDHLMLQFGDFGKIISASTARLRKVAGMNDAVMREFRILETSARRIARSRLLDRPLLSSWQAVLDYCHTIMAHRETEQFRVLFLDRKNFLIADEVQGEGTVDHVPVYPREILRRALELNASALLLVHNHPSGDPTPSQSDITMTQTIRSAAEALSITLHDHIIIGKSCELSFRSAGLL